MIKLPKQLRTPELRFIKLGGRFGEWCKRPIEKNYYSEKNYNCFEIQKYLEETNNNYGIITGKLVVIDFDDELFYHIVKSQLPTTFTVRSAGKGLPHLYYWVDEVFKTIKIDLGTRRIADILGEGNFVAAPNSKKKVKSYEVVSDEDIAFITKSRLLEVFKKWVKVEEEIVVQKPRFVAAKEYYNCWDILKLSSTNYRVVKRDGKLFRGVDPRYGISKGNKHNFFVSDLGWYSFHSGEGGTPTKLLSYLLDCSVEDAIEILKDWRREEK